MLLAVLALAAGGCQGGSGQGITGILPTSMATMDAPPAPPIAEKVAFLRMAGGRAGGPVPSDRKIIRTGSLTLEVRQLDEAVSTIRAATLSAGGHIARESHKALEYGVRSAEITCRLPEARFDATVGGWRKLGQEEAFSIAAEDITEQYFNLDISLRNQQRLEARLLDLLNRPTNRLTDLLEIEKEVGRVRGEIDGLEGRKRFWDAQVSFSSLDVTLHEPRPAIVSDQGGPWRTLVASFSTAGENFVLTVAGIVAASGAAIPLLILLLAVLWAVGRLWRWRRRRRTATPTPSSAPSAS